MESKLGRTMKRRNNREMELETQTMNQQQLRMMVSLIYHNYAFIGNMVYLLTDSAGFGQKRSRKRAVDEETAARWFPWTDRVVRGSSNTQLYHVSEFEVEMSIRRGAAMSRTEER